ncbi:MAG: hypothetical protein KDD14_08530 [Saprospiraceae bacterium]|nr:hypothetical protein [Saprospiraceae bacterium]
MKRVERALAKGDYKMALLKLNAAREHCPEKGAAVDRKILEVFNAIEAKRLEAEEALARYNGSFAAYLTSEAQKAFAKEDIRLAWRLMEAALERDPENTLAQSLKAKMPEYSGEIILETIESSEQAGLGQVYNRPFEIEPTVSPDSSVFAFYTKTDTSINLNVLKLGSALPPRVLANVSLYGYGFSPDSRFLLFFTGGKLSRDTLNLLALDSLYGSYTSYNTAPGAYPTPGHYRHQEFLFSSDGRFLFFTTTSNTLCVLDLANRATPRIFSNVVAIGGINYSPDNRFLAFTTFKSSTESAFNVLELGSNAPPRIFPRFPKPNFIGSYDYTFSPDSRFLTFFTGSDTLKVLELESGAAPRAFPNCLKSEFGYSPDGRFLTFFTGSDTLNVLELDSEAGPRIYPNCQEEVYTYTGKFNCRFSSDSRFLSFFTSSDTLNVLELDSGTAPRIYPGCQNGSFSYSPDSRFLTILSGPAGNSKVSDNLTLYVLELDLDTITGTFSIVSLPQKMSQREKIICFSPDSRFVIFFTEPPVTINKQADLNLLELGKTTTPRVFPYCTGDFIFSSDDQSLAFIANFDLLNVMNLDNTAIVHIYDIISISSENHALLEFKFSPDGRYLFFLNNNDQVNVLEIDSAAQRRIFPNSTSYQCSPDSRFFTVANKEKKLIQVIDLISGQTIREINHQYPVETLEFLNDDYLMTQSINPVTGNYITKLIRLSLGANYWDYYLNEKYAPLSKTEKRAYGILD